MQARKEVRINLSSAKDIGGIAGHAAPIFAHPLQIMRIVSANLKASGVPRPKTLALSAEHLITPVSFVNENLAIGAGLGVGLETGDGSDSVRIANM